VVGSGSWVVSKNFGPGILGLAGGASGLLLCLVVIVFLIFGFRRSRRAGLLTVENVAHFGSRVAPGNGRGRADDRKSFELGKMEIGK